MFITQTLRVLLLTALLTTTTFASPLMVHAEVAKTHVTDTVAVMTEGTAPYTVMDVVHATNEARAKENLSALHVNPTLSVVAYMKALDMASRGYFAHYSPEGVAPWHWFDVAGYNFIHAGENLASGFSTTEGLTGAWLTSPTHRANVLGTQYEEIGVAMIETVRNGKNVWFVVQMFGTQSL